MTYEKQKYWCRNCKRQHCVMKVNPTNRPPRLCPFDETVKAIWTLTKQT